MAHIKRSIQSTLVLRPDQLQSVDNVSRVLHSGKDIAVVKPTGSGKSVEIAAISAKLLSAGWSVTIAGPQLSIIDGIISHSEKYDNISYGENGVDVSSWNFLQRSDDKAHLRSHFELAKRPRDSAKATALVCTNQALLQYARKSTVPRKLERSVLVLDEAHHAEAEGLSKFLDKWRTAGGRLVYYTATPYRSDPKKVIRDDMEVEYLSMAEHMRSGNAPSQMRNSVVAFPISNPVGEAQYEGQLLDEEAKSVANTMVAKWKADGRPKFIAYYPSTTVAKNNAVRHAIISAFKSAKARIVDATGNDPEKFLKVLETERNKLHVESEYDGIIGCGRTREGMDWKHCCAVYTVGMPQSVQLVAQLFGRACRQKSDGYKPSAMADVAEIAFFVPNATNLKKLERVHSHNALAIACFLADHELGQKYVVMKAVRNAVAIARKAQKVRPIDAKAKEDSFLARLAATADSMSPEDIDNKVAMQRELFELQSKLGSVEPSVEQIREALTKSGAPESMVLLEALSNLVASKKSAVIKSIEAKVKSSIVKGLPVDDAMKQAFDAVLCDFAKTRVSLKYSSDVWGRLHDLTGESMGEFAARLRSEFGFEISQVKRWCEKYYDINGKFPTCDSGIVGFDGEKRTWQRVDQWMKNSGVRSLASFINNSFDRAIIGWSIDLIDDFIEIHIKIYGTPPNVNSGVMEGDTRKRKWTAINSWLTSNGYGGLKEYLVQKGLKIDAKLDHAVIKKWISDFRAHNQGKYPTNKNGVIHGDLEKRQWGSIDQWLRNNGYDGLQDFQIQECGRKPKKERLSFQIVRNEITNYYNKTGTWPKSRSQFPEWYDWIGWHHKMTLTEFAVKYCGANIESVRQAAMAARISDITRWCKESHDKGDGWPIDKFGPVVGTNIQWRSVWAWIKRNLNMSPTEFQKKYCGRDNTYIPLNEAVIKQWCIDFHSAGGWPETSSGSIIGDPYGRKWKTVWAWVKKKSRTESGGVPKEILRTNR